VSGEVSSLSHILIRGAREHNLTDFDVCIPRDELVVITGLSGSGKSSLAFDTIYAEGQRRYVESLSAYARQFLEQMAKPDVDSIDGLSPAIAIEQRTVGKSPRSTVGTATEIYDYLRLLYARIGQPHCYGCGKAISSQTLQQMADRVIALGDGTRLQILAPVIRGRKGEHRKELRELSKQGFVRVRVDGEMRELADEIAIAKQSKHDIDVVVDRVVAQDEARKRIAESIETAVRISGGLVTIDVGADAVVLLDGVELPVARVRSDLAERMKRAPGLVVRLRIAPGAPYAAFIAVLDQVKLAGARQLSLETGTSA